MNINIRIDSLPGMFQIFRDVKNGCFDKTKLLKVLNHSDYRYEFERYNQEGLPLALISKEDYVAFFETFLTKTIEEIENPRLKMRYESYHILLNNLDAYEANIEKLANMDRKVYDDGIQIVERAFPNGFQMDDIDIVFTIGIGNSFGWAYKNGIHFDVINFFQYYTLEDTKEFEAFIGHELHHRSFDKLVSNKPLSAESEFYHFLAYEGLAVKYCNNASTKLTQVFDDSRLPNIGMDQFTWNYFTDNYSDIYKQFQNDIERIRMEGHGCINDIMTYWLNIYLPNEDKTKVQQLKHTKNYFIGSEIWGLIHDIYGKEKLYSLLNNLDEFPYYYNKALENIGMDSYKI